MSVILLPEILREKLGEDGAKALVDVLNASLAKAKEGWNETSTERLERRLAETKTDLIKWMFGFWIGQVAVIIALFSLFN